VVLTFVHFNVAAPGPLALRRHQAQEGGAEAPPSCVLLYVVLPGPDAVSWASCGCERVQRLFVLQVCALAERVAADDVDLAG
jgi:hypothetical protein